MLAVLAGACAPAVPSELRPDYAGTCLILHTDPGQLVFTPPPDHAGPAFRLTGLRGSGDYDVQVNAVDAQGRYGPDARGTVHLDASLRTGTMSTPDLQLASGDTAHYDGRWHCTASASTAPPVEPSGGPRG